MIKVDLVMWTKNGEKTLPLVLKRINRVIPATYTNERVIVDDHSIDNTREIAKSFGWNVIFNEGKGIADAANTALKYVVSEYFISFEQDLLLALDWWKKIPRYLTLPNVVIASGIRLPYKPLALKKVQEYVMERYQRSEKAESFFYGKTLDNTIYKTEIIKQLGGFPKLSISAGIDTVLAHRIHMKGFRWVVDYNVRSTHLREGLKDELDHYYWYGTCAPTLEHILYNRSCNLKGMALRAFFSPVRGFHIAIKKRVPEAIYIYPLIRFSVFSGFLAGRNFMSQDAVFTH
ncbi:MAG: glycosyltransferase family A protein [Nitrososphaerota archaeon]